MSHFVLSLICGALGHIILNLGHGFQKAGAHVLPLGLGALSTRARRVSLGLWTLGMALVLTGWGGIFAALSLGEAAVISALGGLGLIALGLFSNFYLREGTSMREIVGIGTIVAGTVMVSLGGPQTDGTFRVSYPLLATYVTGWGAVCVLGLTLGWRARNLRATLAALAAGLSAGSSVLFQKVSSGQCDFSPAHLASLPCLLKSPFIYLALLAGLGAVILLQVAYQHGRAVEIVPVATGALLLSPIFGALLSFGETLAMGQWTGVVLIVLGMVCIATTEKKALSKRTAWASE